MGKLYLGVLRGELSLRSVGLSVFIVFLEVLILEVSEGAGVLHLGSFHVWVEDFGV